MDMLDKLKKLLSAQREESYVEKTPEDVYRGISQKTAMPKEDVAKIGGVESQHGKLQKGDSSAEGIMQIMPRLAKTLRPGSEKSIAHPATQEQLASDVINYNTPTIKELANSNDLLNNYLMYNLGRGHGKKLISAKDEDVIEKILPSKVIMANPKLYRYKTVGEAKKAIQAHLDKRGSNFEFTPTIEDLFKDKDNGQEE